MDIFNPPERTFIFAIHLFLKNVPWLQFSSSDAFQSITFLWLTFWHETLIFSNNFMSKMEGGIATQWKSQYFLRCNFQNLSPCHICFLPLRKHSIFISNSAAHFSISTFQRSQPTWPCLLLPAGLHCQQIYFGKCGSLLLSDLLISVTHGKIALEMWCQMLRCQ